ncbi:hypothetical protein HDU98_008257 [Podochytrium sp. JEL0797]|nr:hypothetical protein HDU98_008257 [Podochytrium sp. JEL0797]
MLPTAAEYTMPPMFPPFPVPFDSPYAAAVVPDALGMCSPATVGDVDFLNFIKACAVFETTLYKNDTLYSEYGKGITNEIMLICTPIGQTVMDEAIACCKFLINKDPHEYKSSASWFRVPANPQEIRAITQMGFTAYFKGRQDKKQTETNKGRRPIAPINNIVAGYLKRILTRVPGGVITESMRRLICAVYEKYPADKRKTLSDHDKAVIQTLLNINHQRLQLLKLVCQVASKILESDPVDPSSLAVVLQVTDVNSCGSNAAEAMLKRMSVNGGSGNHDQDVTNANDMRSLVNVFEEWNRIVGDVFFAGEFPFIP